MGQTKRLFRLLPNFWLCLQTEKSLGESLGIMQVHGGFFSWYILPGLGNLHTRIFLNQTLRLFPCFNGISEIFTFIDVAICTT